MVREFDTHITLERLTSEAYSTYKLTDTEVNLFKRRFGASAQLSQIAKTYGERVVNFMRIYESKVGFSKEYALALRLHVIGKIRGALKALRLSDQAGA